MKKVGTYMPVYSRKSIVVSHHQTQETEKNRFFGFGFGCKTETETKTEKHEKPIFINVYFNKEDLILEKFI